MDTSTRSSLPKRLLGYSLLGVMLAGFVMIGIVFATQRRSSSLSADTEVPISAQRMALPVISTDDAALAPPSAFEALADENSVAPDRVAGLVQIPDADKAATILLAGVAGCASCGFEAQNLSRLQAEYGTEDLRIVFVDIYNFGGPEQLAWFANVLEATNLTWAIDTDGAFRETYGVDIDATLILNETEDILYRDDTVTSYEVLRAQINLALSL